MKCALVASGLLIAASTAHAADVSDRMALTVMEPRFSPYEGLGIGVSLTNLSGTPVRLAFVKCAALNKAGVLVGEGGQPFRNMRPGEEAFSFVTLIGMEDGDYKYRCRVAYATP